jgi:DNA-directed RNA polymerase specialized sigma24 family protein
MAIKIDYESIIIKKSKLGDELAWSILLKQNFRAVYHFCVHLLHGRENEAEDLTQQVFMIAAKMRFPCIAIYLISGIIMA